MDSNFIEGKVVQKGGIVSRAMMNYNLLAGTIAFIDLDKELKMLSDLSDVLVKGYGNRTFIPIGSSEVAEVVKVFPYGVSLLLKRQVDIKNDRERRGPYGTSLVTASSDRITSLYDGD